MPEKSKNRSTNCLERESITLASTGLQRSKSQGPEEKDKELPLLADLIEELEHILTTYISLPDPKLATFCALWVVQTYCFKAFDYCGYLALRSSTPSCGKTRVLSILSLCCSGKPPIYTNITSAVLFRIQNRVLLLDEVDKLRNQDKEKAGEIQAILNAGFHEDGVVPRCVGREFEVKGFPVYGPKALAGLESLADTIADRAFHIHMKRERSRCPRFSERKLQDIARRWRENIQRWVNERITAIENSYQQMPDEVDALQVYESRFQDISEPLYVLAHLADIERHASLEDSERDGYQPILPRLLNALKFVAAKRQPSSRERQIRAIVKLFESHLNNRPSVFLTTNDILEECQQYEELEWIDSARKLASLLKHFELFPDKKRLNNEISRGYEIEVNWVTDCKERYGG